MSTYDAVVVGAGPAGAVTACLLARAGRRVALLDRAAFPRRKACAEYLSPGVLRELETLGLADHVRACRPCPVPGMDVIAAGGRFQVRYSAGGETFEAATLPRHVLDTALVRAACDAGADLLERFVVKEPVGEGRVAGVTGSRDGHRVNVLADVTVVADGARSTLAAKLGLACPPIWPRRLGLVSHYEGVHLPGGIGQMHVQSHGYCGVAPLPGGLVNVGLVVPRDAPRRRRMAPARYLEWWIENSPTLRPLFQEARRVDAVRGVSPVGSRSTRPWTPGALLVGDAAGFFDPFTGEGIYRAVVSGRLAAEVLSACEETAPTEITWRRYAERRSEEFRAKSVVTALVQSFVASPLLMAYALPRLQQRAQPGQTLSAVLGDIEPASAFLTPAMLWEALRP